jgi:hypothetical protein
MDHEKHVAYPTGCHNHHVNRILIAPRKNVNSAPMHIALVAATFGPSGSVCHASNLDHGSLAK